ncbi:hypothetical protein HOB04_01250 [archaeon]|nr:hypothetical protein [archaeon]
MSSVFALGITPARTTLDFKPNLTKQIPFSIINSEKENLTLSISIQGDLKDYISIPTSKLLVSSSEESKHSSYNLTLPEQLGPGLHTADITITQTSEKNGTISATIAVTTQLHIYAPYPEKTANAKLYIYDDNPKNIKFTTLIVNTGKPDITSAKVNIEIYNKLNKKIDTFNTESTDIPSGQIKELTYNWQADISSSKYTAKATITYDNKTLNLTETFNAGIGEDNDTDGYRASDGDCNDNDSIIYPNATEIPYNGIDEDCSGQDLIDVDNDGHNFTIDCDDNDISLYLNLTGYADKDNDTWTFGNATTFCTNTTLPLGYITTQNKEDINDNDSTVYPGAIKATNTPIQTSNKKRQSSTKKETSPNISNNIPVLKITNTKNKITPTNTTTYEKTNNTNQNNITTEYNPLEKSATLILNNSFFNTLPTLEPTQHNLINLITLISINYPETQEKSSLSD